MNIAILSTLIETTTPFGVVFNSWGIAQRGLVYTFSFRKLSVTFKICAINGVWAGNLDVQTNLWGRSRPISRRDFTFASFEECTDYLWNDAYEFIDKNKENVSMEFLRFKEEMKKWLALDVNQKVALFREKDFYA